MIAGFVPDYYFNTLHWPEVNVTVKLDDRILKVLSLKKGGDFRIQQELPANTSALLTIESDRSYVPFMVGMGKDHRELSLVITQIEVE